MTIVEFIRARLDEWAQVAHSVQEVEPKSSSSVFTSLSAPTGTVEMTPACVLAQVAAMRAIVDLLTSRERQDDSEEGLWHKVGYDRAAFDVLRHLAAIWRDHPDYESRPVHSYEPVAQAMNGAVVYEAAREVESTAPRRARFRS